MPLTLMLLRHAKATPSSPELPDHERPLTSRGRRQARRVGRYLRTLPVLPSLVLSSTARRARATARRVVNRLRPKPLRLLYPQLYNTSPDQVLEVIQRVPFAPPSLLVVGHNPCWDQLASQLTGQSISLPTAGLAWIVLPIEQWSELGHSVQGTLQLVWNPADEEEPKGTD